MGKEQDLLDAARCGNIDVVRKILEHRTRRSGPLSSFRRSPNINSQDINGYTPLHHACLNGHINIARLLLEHGATTDVRDVRGSTPLYVASWAGFSEIVEMLLMHQHNPANPNCLTEDNDTPLHCSAQHGHSSVLAILLAYSADPCIWNNSFQTPLDLAAQYGRLRAVQMLLRADPKLLDPYRISEHSSTTHVFRQTCLHLASRNGHKKVVEELLAAGVDVNIRTNAGTALHEAALCGKKSVVVTLLTAGIDVDATDSEGRTALDLLKDYSSQATYDIVSFIKGAKNSSWPGVNKPVADENDNYELGNSQQMRDKSHSMPLSAFPKKNKKLLEPQKTLTLQDLKSNPKVISNSLNSLIESPSGSVPGYLPMKPINWQKSTSDLAHEQELKSVVEAFAKKKLKPSTPPKLQRRGDVRNSPSSSSSEHEAKPSTKYYPRAEYVQMSTPDTSNQSSFSSGKGTPTTAPSNSENEIYPPVDEREKRTMKSSFASVRRLSKDDLSIKEHSPTPEFPPPSVQQAERAIHKAIKPLTLQKRKPISAQDEDALEGDLQSFIENDLNLENLNDCRNSRASEYLEKYVGDQPFAGLFKGSTLNLHWDDDSVERQVPPPPPIRLRSPGLVRQVKPKPAPRKLKQQNSVTTKTPTEDFNETAVWEEINNIFQSIGNEVGESSSVEKISTAAALEQSHPSALERKETFKLRQPSDLLLGSKNANTNWCHSTTTLIYGQILYDVFYLGSTIIRELQGTTSTRKSIQKLKCGETPVEQSPEQSLLEDCNSSTKILKQHNHQMRFKVGISVSCAGVRFIDNEKKSTICHHDIQNINCVCQDAEDLRYFAYITKDRDMHYCHVFMVDNLELATEIILTLGQAFEVAYQMVITKDSSMPPIAEEKRNSYYIDIEELI